MFDTVLIANRGEIACRVIRTARHMGLRTVAVYSDADAEAMHVHAADAAVRIGPPPAKESYLRIEAILEAARRSGAGAIHPGYGFLSENAGFAEACAKAGLVFIGPPASAIRAMGSKSAAKALMEKARVPVVPGYHGAEQAPDHLREQARRVGFPLLIKAVAGGGGKGMRRVDAIADFDAALAGAKREAANAFGDDAVLIERYVLEPRHIEIQVFADTHGDAVYLFERDCSVQRRHQKVIEEAPGPNMTPDRRRAMGEAAVAAAKAIGYVGAGTVEFIAGSGGDFYFMEMNTRLQVEHPVTELITGQDLVEWQIRVARGEALPAAQDKLAIRGHAIEARLYAEDPQRDFLPATGTLTRLRFPPADPAGPVRVDTGVREGDAVSIHYDPMIAKLIVWAEDRPRALARMAEALAETEIAGPATNAEFLRRLVRHPDFAAGRFDTGFIARHRDALVPAAAPAPRLAIAFAALAVEMRRAEAARAEAASSQDPWSPWSVTSGWRMNDEAPHGLAFKDRDAPLAVTVHYRRDGYDVDIAGQTVRVRLPRREDGAISAEFDGMRRRAGIGFAGARVLVFLDGARHELEHLELSALAGDVETEEGGLTAPLSGKVVDVLVKDGATVERGQPLLIVEAMKMEHTIAAPADGTVERVLFGKGDQVQEGAALVEFAKAKAQ